MSCAPQQLLLALLEECNPDVSDIVAPYRHEPRRVGEELGPGGAGHRADEDRVGHHLAEVLRVDDERRHANHRPGRDGEAFQHLRVLVVREDLGRAAGRRALVGTRRHEPRRVHALARLPQQEPLLRPPRERRRRRHPAGSGRDRLLDLRRQQVKDLLGARQGAVEEKGFFKTN